MLPGHGRRSKRVRFRPAGDGPAFAALALTIASLAGCNQRRGPAPPADRAAGTCSRRSSRSRRPRARPPAVTTDGCRGLVHRDAGEARSPGRTLQPTATERGRCRQPVRAVWWRASGLGRDGAVCARFGSLTGDQATVVALTFAGRRPRRRRCSPTAQSAGDAHPGQRVRRCGGLRPGQRARRPARQDGRRGLPEPRRRPVRRPAPRCCGRSPAPGQELKQVHGVASRRPRLVRK